MVTDYPSGLPIRSESDGTDEKVVVKIIDGTNGGTNQVSVDTDKNLHVEVHGNSPSSADEVLRLSELGAITPDGVYDVANNTKPGNVGVIASSRAVTTGDATQNKRLTSVAGQSDSQNLDVSLHHSNGNEITEDQPLAVTFVDAQGIEVNDYFESATPIAAGASTTHTYTATAAFKFTEWHGASAARSTYQVETSQDGSTFTKMVYQLNSTANPNCGYTLREPVSIPSGGKIKITLTNKDNQASTMYSTICGHYTT